MSRYNNNRFTPGNKGNLRLFMNKAFIRQYYQTFNTSQTFDNILTADDITEGTLCGCIPPRSNLNKQGWNDSSQTENNSFSQKVKRGLGSRITYGNQFKPITINYLGGWEGQPGGSLRPPRNNF